METLKSLMNSFSGSGLQHKMPFGMPKGVAADGCSWTLMALKTPYLLDFRHI
jgi:hypothetical protein